MKVSVIITTFNNPKWLEKVLWGYECQFFKNFEIIVADDGSDQPTADLIERFQSKSSLKINHVWHPRNGYQKCQILNKAIKASYSDYLIFTDGDCIPRKDFVAQHVSNARKGFYLSGGVLRLPMQTSELLNQEDIVSGKAFKISFLKSCGHDGNFFKNLKLNATGPWAKVLNSVTTRRPTWNGGNSSGWRSDLLAVNGFNEDMEYGGQDTECGWRLINYGIKPKQLVFSLAALHLDHERSYKTEESVTRNQLIIANTRQNKTFWAVNGIDKMHQLMPNLLLHENLHYQLSQA